MESEFIEDVQSAALIGIKVKNPLTGNDVLHCQLLRKGERMVVECDEVLPTHPRLSCPERLYDKDLTVRAQGRPEQYKVNLPVELRNSGIPCSRSVRSLV